jgi:hypothetical protein
LIEALDEPDGLFIKNLENVQGDERDVILFSTAFSVNDRGVLPLNFGPLNRGGGERRLNVAVTRARRQVMVFSSFEPEQLRAEETSSIGIRNLRTYLDMAARGPDVLPSDPRRRATSDRHREQIAQALRSHGLIVSTDVGLSEFKVDLTIAEQGAPDSPKVAVLLDGPAWAARGTVHDRDGLPRDVLVHMMRWPAVERVWLPTWIADPEAVIARLVKALATAGEQAMRDNPSLRTVMQDREPIGAVGLNKAPFAALHPLASTENPARQAKLRSVEPVVPPAAKPARPPVGDIFVPWAVQQYGDVTVLDALPAPWAVRYVENVLAQVVFAEGPIHKDRLGRLVGLSFGLGKVVGNRRTAILRHLPPSFITDDQEPVVWPAELDLKTWTGFRATPEGIDRPLEHVALREIINAMVAVCRESAGISSKELHRAVLGTFGFRRLTAGMTQRLEAALVLGVKSGRLLVDDNGVVHPARISR